MNESFKIQPRPDRLRFAGEWGTMADFVLVRESARSRIVLRRSGRDDMTIAVGDDAAVAMTFAEMTDRWRPAPVGSGAERTIRILRRLGFDAGILFMLLSMLLVLATVALMAVAAMLLPDNAILDLAACAALLAASTWIGLRIVRLANLMDAARTKTVPHGITIEIVRPD